MFEIDDPAFDDFAMAWMAGVGTRIAGRVTYLQMAEFFAKSSHPARRR